MSKEKRGGKYGVGLLFCFLCVRMGWDGMGWDGMG